jgi:hypothetical protein
MPALRHYDDMLYLLMTVLTQGNVPTATLVPATAAAVVLTRPTSYRKSISRAELLPAPYYRLTFTCEVVAVVPDISKARIVEL